MCSEEGYAAFRTFVPHSPECPHYIQCLDQLDRNAAKSTRVVTLCMGGKSAFVVVASCNPPSDSSERGEREASCQC